MSLNLPPKVRTRPSTSRYVFCFMKIRYLTPPLPTRLIPAEDQKAVSRQKVRITKGILEDKVFVSRGSTCTIWSVITRVMKEIGRLQVGVRLI